MKKILIPFILASMIVLLGCGSSVRIFTDIDDAGQFEQYGSYSFLDFTEGNLETITGMELERIRVAIARELERRGLEYVEKDGDVSVKITVYHRQALDGFYRSSWRYNYLERALAVDVYDNVTRKHVWHGAAVGELVYDPQERAERLPEVAAMIFEKYPVQPPGEI